MRRWRPVRRSRWTRHAAIICAMCCGGRRATSVLLFNGRDGEWLAEIEALAKSGARLAVQRQTVAQRLGPDLWLVFAPLKRERIDLLAEKATELGCRRAAAGLHPAHRREPGQCRAPAPPMRWRRRSRPSGSTCRRCASPRRLGELLAELAGARAGIILCAEAGAARPSPRRWRARPHGDRCGPWAVMTGPEGGFARSELDASRANCPLLRPSAWGRACSRADTAAIAALACWQALLGDGRERPPAR